MTELLKVNNVSYSYGKGAVISDIRFTIREGERVALVGPNGVGKTTLLKLVMGLMAPHSGAIEIQGTDVQRISIRERAKLMALVPQELSIPFDFTVEEVVEQGRTPHLSVLQRLRLSDHQAVELSLQDMDLLELRDRPFNQLSGGERQRVKVAVALAQRPKLLMLDEPTQNLDIGRQTEILRSIARLNQSGVTIFAAVHDLNLVSSFFQSVIFMCPRRGLGHGTPSELFTEERLEHAFASKVSVSRNSDGTIGVIPAPLWSGEGRT